jgi:hypothetical protein
MKRPLFALSAVAAQAAGSIGAANALDFGVGPRRCVRRSQPSPLLRLPRCLPHGDHAPHERVRQYGNRPSAHL